LPQREPTPPTPSPPSSPKLEDVLAKASSSELNDLEEEAANSETERIIASYRARRLGELRQQTRSARFGDVYPISREDYTKEVTEASKVNSPEQKNMTGTGVVCFLYKDGQITSTKLSEQLKELARRYPHTKFVSIIGSKCIPNYADKLCPTLIVYRNGELTRQVVAWGADRERTIAELEAMLILSLAITSPPQFLDYGEDRLSSGENYEEDEHPDMTLQRDRQRNIRTSAKKPDDSDSDFDL